MGIFQFLTPIDFNGFVDLIPAPPKWSFFVLKSMRSLFSIVTGIPILGDIIYPSVSAWMVWSCCCSLSCVDQMKNQQKSDAEWLRKVAAGERNLALRQILVLDTTIAPEHVSE